MYAIGTLRRIIGTITRIVLVSTCVLGGCTHREIIKLHYLDGFVPGNRAIFLPANIAVAPVNGHLATGIHEVGSVYDSSGRRESVVRVGDAGPVVQNALMASLADAGLKPIALDSAIAPDALPSGVDVMLGCELQELKVEKNFGAQQSIHGQYFTMDSRVRLKFQLRRRDGSTLYDNEIEGVENEPPKPVDGEVFLPLETEPVESLSVALSRAVGGLIADPKFRAVLPSRTP